MQAAQHAQMLQEEAIKQVELRRRMRATAVPVIDTDVRATLRQLGEPVTLFGEQQVYPRQLLPFFIGIPLVSLDHSDLKRDSQHCCLQAVKQPRPEQCRSVLASHRSVTQPPLLYEADELAEEKAFQSVLDQL